MIHHCLYVVITNCLGCHLIEDVTVLPYFIIKVLYITMCGHSIKFVTSVVLVRPLDLLTCTLVPLNLVQKATTRLK